MKKNKFKVIKIISLIIIISFFSDKIQAFNNLKSQESENLRVSTIEQIYDEISFIQLDKNLSENKKKEKISALHEQLSSLGVKDMNASEFIKLAGDVNNITPYAFDVAPGPDIIRQLNKSYYIKSYITNYGNLRQNHVTFENKSADPYLMTHSQTTQFGSTNNINWIQKIISIYAEKAIGSIPVVQWLPYELLGISSTSKITGSGNALSLQLSTNSIQKFVFVEKNNRWHYSLSVNKVVAEVFMRKVVSVRGGGIDSTNDTKRYTIYGDYKNASYLAHTNIGLGINKCISSVKIYSQYKGGVVISNKIHNPNSYLDMF